MRNLYSTDVLTGLYNRRGFGMFFEDYYNECKENHTNLAVFLIDMDNMKTVNDTLGHDEGDYCLCTIAHAMKEAAVDDDICIRSGGDEFVVLGKDYDEDKIAKFITDLRHAIALKRRKDGKAYDISVSVGCYMQIPTDDGMTPAEAGEAFLRYADTAMYKEKKEHKMALQDK